MKYYKLVAVLVLLLMFAPLADVTASKDVKNETIAEDNDYTDWLYGIDKGDTIKITGTASGPIDVYIISNDNFWSGYVGSSGFTPAYQVLNVRALSFSWEVPDDQLYVLVLDNRDNGNAGASPVGPVVVNYARNDPGADSTQNAVNMMCALGIIVVIVIIVIMVAVVYLVMRKKRVAAPQQPVYQQPYYQQPAQQYYQQAPAQYYQQPPPQQPPYQYPPR